MHIGINLYSKWPYEEVIQAFLENGIKRTFVCVEHPCFDEVMAALKKTDIVVDNLHAPFKDRITSGKMAKKGRKLFRTCATG